jgi:hypothetical protein
VLAVTLLGGTLARASLAGPLVVELLAMHTQVADLDLGAASPSQGDQVIFADDLSSRGERPGTNGGVCTAVASTPMTTTPPVRGNLSLPHGQVAAQGVGTFHHGDEGPTPEIAVTGGTGTFRAAHGELRLQPIDNLRSRITPDRRALRRAPAGDQLARGKMVAATPAPRTAPTTTWAGVWSPSSTRDQPIAPTSGQTASSDGPKTNPSTVAAPAATAV